MPAFAAMAREHLDDIIEFMPSRAILFEEEGMLSLGAEGERAFGRRHFMELMSAFTSTPLFTVRHGRAELGFVDPLSFQVRRSGPAVLLLGGRSWEVSQVDWERRVVYVKAAREKGRSRWMGSRIPLRFELCRAIRRVLDAGKLELELSSRAQGKLKEICEDFSWIDATATAVI